jgi:hypothetical protein
MGKKFLKKGLAVSAPVQARTRSTHRGWDIVALDEVRVDGGTQSRVAFDADAITEYAEAMRADASGLVLDGDGEPWPPLVVFDDGESLWLADGFHRLRAAKSKGLGAFQIDKRAGELRDAIRLSLSVNHKNGVRRTNADKKLSVERALQDPEWGKLSDRALSDLCKVSAPTVARHRARLEGAGAIAPVAERLGADGRVQGAATRSSKARGSLSGALDAHGFDVSRLVDGLGGRAVRASTLDSRTKRRGRRDLMVVTSASPVDLGAALDHAPTLLAEGGTLVAPLTDLSALAGVMERAGKIGLRAHAVALQRSRGLALVLSPADADAPPAWAKGLGSLIDAMGHGSAHVIQGSEPA